MIKETKGSIETTIKEVESDIIHYRLETGNISNNEFYSFTVFRFDKNYFSKIKGIKISKSNNLCVTSDSIDLAIGNEIYTKDITNIYNSRDFEACVDQLLNLEKMITQI